jgi:hypothetical protein
MKQFEKQLKQQLYAHETPVNTDALFAILQPQLPKSQPVLWKWALPLCLACAFGLILWSVYAKKQEQPVNTKQKSAIIADKEGNTENISIKNTDKEAIIVSKEEIIPNKEAIAQNKQAIIDNKGRTIKQNSGTIDEKEHNIDSKGAIIVNKEAIIEQKKNNIASIQDKTPIAPPKTEDINPSLRNTQGHVAELSNMVQPLPLPKLEHSFKKRYVAGRGPNFQIGVGAHLGIGHAIKSLKVKPDAADTAEPYLTSRKDSEKSLETLGAGLDLYLKHQKGIYLRTGISGGRMAEKFETSFSVTETFTDPNGIIEIIIDTNGDTTFVRGPVSITRTTTYEKRSYNYLTFYDLPLVLGYEFDGAPWHLGLEAGAHLNLAFASRGEIFAPSGGILNLEAQRNDIFNPKMGLSLYAGLRASYDLGERLQLTLAPHLRHFPKSLTVGNYPLEQRYTMLGLDAGIRFMLNAGSGREGCYKF